MTDKYIDSLQSDSDQEYKFEELESSDDKLSVTDMFKVLKEEIKEIKVSQNKVLANITKVQTQVNKQEAKSTSLEKSQHNLNTRVDKLEHVVQRDFNPELTIVAINAPRFANEEPMQLAKQIVDATGSNSDCVVNAMHTAPLRHNHKGVFKIEMASQADKKVVLQHKKNLKNSSQFNKVYLRSSQTHAERLIHLNFRKVLEELPNGNEFRMTGNGRLTADNTHQQRNLSMKDYMDHSGRGKSSDSQTSVKVNYSTTPGSLDMSVKPKSYAQVVRVSQPIDQGDTFNHTHSQVPLTQNQYSQDRSQCQLILQPQSPIQGDMPIPILKDHCCKLTLLIRHLVKTS